MFAKKLVPAALTITALAGCATTGGAPNRTTADARCTKSPSTNPTTPVVAVLGGVGTTDPATAQTDQQALAKVIAGSEQLKANLLINGVTGQTDAPNLVLTTQMSATGINTLTRGQNLKCKETAAKAAYTSLRSTPATTKVDLLSALRTLKRDVDGTQPSEIHVVVLASVRQTETINLASGQTLNNPAQAINRLAAQQLNFTCPNWRVYLITDDRGNGSPINSAEDVKLEAWWSAYFARCGGTLVTYNNELARFPLPDQTAEGADLRHIGVAFQNTPRRVTARLSSDALFDTGSANLRPGADQALNPVLAAIGTATGTITITGYTDNTGTDTINRPLSMKRAQTVAAWLSERSGLQRDQFETRGSGSSNPTATNQTPDGRAQNRRVVAAFARDPRA
jgi:outer membrane protein OmpA-like peptidoglycan-associated protein